MIDIVEDSQSVILEQARKSFSNEPIFSSERNRNVPFMCRLCCGALGAAGELANDTSNQRLGVTGFSQLEKRLSEFGEERTVPSGAFRRVGVKHAGKYGRDWTGCTSITKEINIDFSLKPLP